MRHKGMLATVACVAAALVATAVAHAGGGKERVVVDSFVGDYAFAIDCGEFGPYAFENEVAGSGRERVTDVYDENGALLQTVVHFVFRETETNSVSGKTLPLEGAGQVVLDWGTNTRTLTGAVAVGTEPGEGIYVQDTGRITFTLDTREALFVAGPHEGFFAGGIDAVVCPALAEG
jgi:hypothetical protein